MEKIKVILTNETPAGDAYERSFDIDHARNIMKMIPNGGWKVKDGQNLPDNWLESDNEIDATGETPVAVKKKVKSIKASTKPATSKKSDGPTNNRNKRDSEESPK